MTGLIDPIELAQALIKRPSVTPADAGALDVLETALTPLGFKCIRLPFGEGAERIDNLYARIGTSAPHFSFAGHTDVVPPGDEAKWSSAPFAANLHDGRLYGRGAADMKGGIAAFAAAASRHIAKGAFNGSISLLITGDEEGDSINGTEPMLRWLKANGEHIDHCVVGEPTNRNRLGDMAKIGRRGSFTVTIKSLGVQGHVAYPHLADNPLPRLVALLDRFSKAELDHGTEHFQPSNLEIVTIDTGNKASNVIPAEATARFNIRFNDRHTQAGLRHWVTDEILRFQAEFGGEFETTFQGNGEAFLTAPGAFTDLICEAIAAETGTTPELSTSGGTSDARFIKDYAPVVEFGLVGDTMHKIDENVPVADIEALTRIYSRVLVGYFERF
ncbi:MAG: succinyl-diaminopimelate desuccinylase [Alphaproteobacteria bacterium]